MEDNDLYYGDLNEEALKVHMKNSENVDEEVKEEEEKEQESNSQAITTPITDSTMMVPIAMPSLHLYPIDNYTFGTKDSLMEIETSYHNRMAHLADSFAAEGMRRTVEAVMLTYENNHPHVLLLQLGESTIFKL